MYSGAHSARIILKKQAPFLYMAIPIDSIRWEIRQA